MKSKLNLINKNTICLQPKTYPKALRLRLGFSLSLLLLGFSSPHCYALNSIAAPAITTTTPQQNTSSTQDNNPLLINSQQTQMDFKTGVNVYEGNVVATHGKSRLSGDKMTTYRDKNNKISKVVIIGKQATLHAEEDQDEKPVDAKANKITFFPITHDVLLEGNATAVQDKNVINAPVIKYNTETKVMQAVSNKQTRLHILIYNNQPQENTTTSATPKTGKNKP